MLVWKDSSAIEIWESLRQAHQLRKAFIFDKLGDILCVASWYGG